jgi:predicted  nucleic acid-binding Zn-ribbon protein
VNAQLGEATSSSSEQLDKANKLAIEAQREATKLKKELDPVKDKLEEEEKQRTEAQTRADKKGGDLRKSIKTLLGKLLRHLYLSLLVGLL